MQFVCRQSQLCGRKCLRVRSVGGTWGPEDWRDLQFDTKVSRLSMRMDGREHGRFSIASFPVSICKVHTFKLFEDRIGTLIESRASCGECDFREETCLRLLWTHGCLTRTNLSYRLRSLFRSSRKSNLVRDVRPRIRQICPSERCFAIECSDGRGSRQGRSPSIEELACVLLFLFRGRTFRLGEVKMRAFPRDELLATEQLVRYPFETLSRIACVGQYRCAWP